MALKFENSVDKVVVEIKKEFCPRCKNLAREKDCPFLAMCVVSIYSLEKDEPLHFKPTG